MDFGLATKKGTLVTGGPMAFRPPEQFKNDDYGHGHDAWSFGILLQKLITGRTPTLVTGGRPEDRLNVTKRIADELVVQVENAAETIYGDINEGISGLGTPKLFFY